MKPGNEPQQHRRTVSSHHVVCRFGLVGSTKCVQQFDPVALFLQVPEDQHRPFTELSTRSTYSASNLHFVCLSTTFCSSDVVSP